MEAFQDAGKWVLCIGEYGIRKSKPYCESNFKGMFKMLNFLKREYKWGFPSQPYSHELILIVLFKAEYCTESNHCHKALLGFSFA